MDLPLHSYHVAITPLMVRSWPTRIPCHAATEGRDNAGADQSLLTALSGIERHHAGWIMLIAPPGRPTVARLQEQGIDPNRVLVVHKPKIKNWQRMLERSLCAGHCAAVFTWLPDQIDIDQAKLQQLGQQSGVVTHFFNKQIPRTE